jgi:nicotinamide-nucleotide amidase
MIDQLFFNQAAGVLAACRAKGLTVATAESCTGGLVAAALTAVPGSSEVVERGFVTYSNQAKIDMLAVPVEAIQSFGAVSEAVARAMAEGALARSRATLSVAITGVAGPGGGTDAKPVGLVHLAAFGKSGASRHVECSFGAVGREEIRKRAVAEALRLLRQMADEHAVVA